MVTKLRKSSDAFCGAAKVGGSCCRMWYMHFMVGSSNSGGWPSNSSMAVIPSDQMSALQLYCPYSKAVMISGGIQQGVPVKVSAQSRNDEVPKSPSLMSPESVTSTFAALTSLWIFPCACM
eukprot:Lithocolla_globosa_v1_NODE_1311_length_2682_cov_6.141606.p3 type:complete len:121 gc:universal NODE_1311_length_2682_cov_6.141606:878-516(-)